MTLDFPPLLDGHATADDPVTMAKLAACSGCDAGALFYRITDTGLVAAVVLAPETPMAMAEGVALTLPLALNDAIGALAPPEIGVAFQWPDGLLLNGARAGGFCFLASDSGEAVPDWFVLGFDTRHHDPAPDPGARPDETAFDQEGAGDLDPTALLAATSRHLIHWLHRFETDGLAPLARALTPISHDIANHTALGLDDRGRLLVRDGDATLARPLFTTGNSL